ncbi:MAG: right-handed parallel beta-helix repeat-containing protein [Planctomycetota bacterium]
MAYTEVNFFGGLPQETFPIALPSGATLTPVDATPVFIWHSSGVAPTAIIRVSPGATLTSIGRMNILGGAIGVEVLSSSGDVLLRECTLGRSAVNFSAIAMDGALLDVELTDCRIVDDAVDSANPPILASTSIGIRMHAIEETAGIPVLTGAINGLTAVGDFSNLGSAGLLNPRNDMERSTGQGFSRLIEVFANGDTAQDGGNQIAEAIVTVTGGVMEGGASPTADGWDLGIYASLGHPNPSGDVDYRAGYVVTVIGASISNFVEAGIYATADLETRGQIELRGQTVISDTGSLESHTPGDYQHSGVHLFNLEGYLSLSASDSIIRDNTGNGVALRSQGTIRRDASVDMGMPLAMRRCQVYRNDGDGIELQSSVGTFLNPTFGIQPGIVGGTHTIVNSETILENGSMSDPFPTGQGAITQCAISNNGERGIRMQVGAGGSDTFIYCRVTNSIIWNNPLGGFVGEFFDPFTGMQAGGYMLSPLVHCTLVGNGGAAAPYNIEFIYPTMSGIGGRYYWDNLGSGTFETGTEIDNCIFDRLSTGTFDFGLNLTDRAVDSVDDIFADPDEIGVGGVRLDQLGTPSFPESTEDSAPFVGPIVLTSIDPTQFFISGTPLTDPEIIDSTPMYINVFSPEVATDFAGGGRPGAASGDNDKGADEAL